MKEKHVIRINDFKGYTHDVELASDGDKVLAATIVFNCSKIMYRVGRRGDETSKESDTLEKAIDLYNKQ